MKRSLFWIALGIFLILGAGCGKSKEFEEGKKAYETGMYEKAQILLEKAKSNGKNVVEADKMLLDIKQKLEVQAEEACVKQAESHVKILESMRDVDPFEKSIEELKAFRCGKVDTKPMADKAYYTMIAYLADWEKYPEAVRIYCGATGCQNKPVRIWVYEEEVERKGPDGKKKLEIEQEEIPIADHGLAMEMYKWLITKDVKNCRGMDRYAKFLFDNQRYTEAKEAYKFLSELKGAPYEIKSRAQLTLGELDKGKRPTTMEYDYVHYFWKEDAKQKSKIKGLKSEMEAEKPEGAAPGAKKDAPK